MLLFSLNKLELFIIDYFSDITGLTFLLLHFFEVIFRNIPIILPF
jgi:hypothetical protein